MVGQLAEISEVPIRIRHGAGSVCGTQVVVLLVAHQIAD
jgi:hypothetical protein